MFGRDREAGAYVVKTLELPLRSPMSGVVFGVSVCGAFHAATTVRRATIEGVRVTHSATSMEFEFEGGNSLKGKNKLERGTMILEGNAESTTTNGIGSVSGCRVRPCGA